MRSPDRITDAPRGGVQVRTGFWRADLAETAAALRGKTITDVVIVEPSEDDHEYVTASVCLTLDSGEVVSIDADSPGSDLELYIDRPHLPAPG